MILRTWLGFLSLVVVAVNSASGTENNSGTKINPDGITTMSFNERGASVAVALRTHTVAIDNGSPDNATIAQRSCTFSVQPCSVIDSLEIRVGGQALFIPRSLYADISDLTSARLIRDGKNIRLSLAGGDASESFILEIEFDALRIKHRMLSSALLPHEALQETTYYERIMGD